MRGEVSLHEGCYDDCVVGLDAFAGAVAAGYFLARRRLGVAVCCGTMLDVKLEVFIVKLRGGDGCGVDMLERGLSWGAVVVTSLLQGVSVLLDRGYRARRSEGDNREERKQAHLHGRGIWR